ncbi:MAG TPA: CaiB/BaiF CoA-transferase family protein [Ktedonobacteraceae bacterium]|jgi:alpha-methylacyl-CoA racemase|nr:CaiB/BaiF CoA-transferase family protein [Ktedonobacteraceae bacterium]
MSQPLNGIRVLDLSRLLPGAYASQMLADFGADVIKIEEPRQGDYSRGMPPYSSGGMGLYYLAVNRNKRSLTLNLKSERGRALFLELLEHADVLLESFRPGVLARLGLGYEQLKTRYPRLIYCAISGYGQDGPYSQRAGHDLNYAGYAGLLHYNRDEQGEPVLPATQLGDLVGGGLLAVIGILTALFGRSQSGQGCLVDAAMTEGILSLLPVISSIYLSTGKAPSPGYSLLDGALPCYNIYETKDGRYVTLAALEQKFWHAFCTHVGHLELLPFHSPVGPDERNEAMQLLRGIFKTKTRDEWVAELAEIDACVGPVYSLEEALQDPHMQARDVVQANDEFRGLRSFPRLSTVDPELRYVPPHHGEQTEAILQELGYRENEIAQMRAEGTI